MRSGVPRLHFSLTWLIIGIQRSSIVAAYLDRGKAGQVVSCSAAKIGKNSRQVYCIDKAVCVADSILVFCRNTFISKGLHHLVSAGSSAASGSSDARELNTIPAG
ncbi:MAG: hypothetical protein ACI9G1_001176 [Pirellulaceae bacterium]|jgi:hypothetical protein